MERIEQTFKVFDNFLEITPSKEFVDNSIYEIRIKGLKALNSNKKLDTLNLKVVTAFTPAYCSIESIYPLVEVFGIPEDRILYYIREASRYADYIQNSSVSKNNATVSFEVEQFVKTKATLDALLKAYIEKASSSGSKGTLGYVSYENTENFAGIKELIKLLKAELKNWEDAVRGYFNEGRAKPKATKIGIEATPVSVDTLLNDFTRTLAQVQGGNN